MSVRLAIGLLLSHGFPAPTAFWSSFHKMQYRLQSGEANQTLPTPLHIRSLSVLEQTAFPVDFARNEVVRQVLRDDTYTHLFFADCDHVFPADTVDRLLAHDKPVVSARYHMRKEPYHAVAYVKHRVLEGPHCYAPVHFGQGVFEIERGGAGALLIKREVLEAIRDREGENWFRYQRGPTPPHDMSVSEDFWFWRCAREAGFSCWLDWDLEVGHLQEFAINRSWNAAYLSAQVREMASLTPERRQAVLDSFVVCGFPEGFRLESGEIVPPYSYSEGER